VATDEEALADIARRLGETPSGHRLRGGLPLKGVLVAFAVLVLVVVGGPWLVFHVIESPAPSALHLPPAQGVAAGAPAPGPVSGTWRVAPGTVAGYRVEEDLLGQHHTAVGRTSKVSGGIVISGSTVTAADFTVDLAAVKSDQLSRVAQFNGFIMETYEHPNGHFHLTEPIRLGEIPAPGKALFEWATGQLSLRGVTRPITFRLGAERVGEAIDVNAEIPVDYSQWHIPNPTFAVAQVSDVGTIEVLLHLVRAG
jgi:polyisoprenoid-binding protein YceI